MNTIMFQVGNNDYSNRVVAEGYEVQKDDLYDSWTDANGKDHHSAYRTRISGKFTLKFLNIGEYEGFITALMAWKNDDLTYPVKIFDNYSGQTVDINAFIKFTASRYRMPNWDDNVKPISVEIMEQ